MIDPNTVLDWSVLLAWWNPEAIMPAVTSVATGTAISYGLHRWKKGRRLGTLTTEGVVVRRGWLRTRLEAFWPKPIVHRVVRTLGLGVVALTSYLGLLAFDLPGGALTQGAFALAAAANLWFYWAQARGRCLVFRKGLWVEGAFYQWDQVCLERSEGEAVFMIGKDELRLPAVVLDRHIDWLDTPLRVKWICLRNLSAKEEHR